MGLKTKRLALDTSPFIYYFEKHPVYLDLIKPYFEAIARGEIEAFTSTVTLIEVLVLPFKKGQNELANRYEEFLTNAANLTIIEVTPAIAKKAAELRAKYTIRTPDAIQIATGIVNEVELVLTNDDRLKAIKEIKIATIAELKST